MTRLPSFPSPGAGSPPAPPKRLLVIMAKEPLPGAVKTRLHPPLSPGEAAELYRCLVEDRVEQMRGLGPEVARAIAYAPLSALPYFSSLAGGEYLLWPQAGGGLSERLTALFSRSFSLGYGAVAVIDSDSPDLPAEAVLEAYRRLDEGSDVVFGPCDDGGYYLVALRRNVPELLQGIPWSTSGVLAESLRTAGRLGLRAALLPRRQDIDRFEDLLEFVRRCESAPPAAAAPRTVECIGRLLSRGRLAGEFRTP